MRHLEAFWPTHDESAALVDRLGELVGLESPTGSASRLASCADVLSDWGRAALGRAPERIVLDGHPHLLWASPDQRVLLLGHFDTAWPAGTVADWPFSVTGRTATGPGAFDMKAGIVQMFAALGLLADYSRVGVLLTGDEQSGSATSRPLIEREARRSGAVLVCEPGAPDGTLRVARDPRSATMSARVLEIAGTVAEDIGLTPPAGTHAPGAPIADFVAALGVPMLDGLGAVGGGARTRSEHVDVSALPDRVALLAALTERLMTTSPTAEDLVGSWARVSAL